MAHDLSRRTLIASSLLASIVSVSSKSLATEKQGVSHRVPTDVLASEPDFKFEFTQTKAEWKRQLSESDYRILRLGKTEKKKSSPLRKEKRVGNYRCKGCNLLTYTSEHKANINKGWVFFQHNEPNSVLMGIDLITSYSGREKPDPAIEAHCRRCGSHLGHVLYVKNQILHCVNGASLTFEPTA